MVLDHCPSLGSSEEEINVSARRTLEWARRSAERSRNKDAISLCPHGEDRLPLTFAITQGGTYIGIRERNTRKLVELDLPGYGIGGLSIGEGKEEMFTSLGASTSCLPVEKPRYFMGVGEPRDLVQSVIAGVDVFDSVFPTRNARHRTVLLPDGSENIRAGRWKGVDSPIFEGCRCYTCRNHTRAFLHHLFKAEEPLGPRLATIHNVHFMQELVKGLRERILEGDLEITYDPQEIIRNIFPAN
jgi:queuine tRNA-ribosyltransferase